MTRMPLAVSFAASFSIFAVTTPYLPVLIRESGYGPAVVGLLLGSFEIAGIAGPFLTGRVADRLGRFRPALGVSYVLLLLPLAPLLWVRHPAAALGSLIVFAIGLKSIIPLVDASATIALGKTGDYGRVRVVASISFVLVSLFLQYQRWMPPDAPFRIAFWIVVTTVVCICCLPLLPERERRVESSGPRHEGATRRKFIDAPFAIGIALIALSRLAMAPIYSFFSLYVLEELRWDAVGTLWSLSAASEIPIMLLSARIITRFGAPAILGLSSLAIVVRLALYALLPTPVGVVVAQLLHSLCFGLFHIAGVGFISTRVPPERRATGMAIYLSLGYGLPTFLGSALGGLIVEVAGYRALYGGFTVFALGAVILYLITRKTLETPARSW